ncbi:Speckle-type POZ protein-like protein [Hordeum vulgare]|nr:Speckle-type POZ protein-like protein [Hordeum vulgare]
MSSFAGVSILEDGKLCPSTTTFVETRSECGYHLLVVQDYSRTKKETPTGHGIASRGFGVGGHRWCINYYPNGENSTLFPSTYPASTTVVTGNTCKPAGRQPDIRCVLAARSTIFMAQLFGPTKEGTAAPVVIRIKDMKPKVFKALLSFIYTESFPMMEYDDIDEDDMPQIMEEEGQEAEATDQDGMLLQWLGDLLVAADRYDAQRLKCICVKQLSKNMGVLSVMSTLGLAEQHHSQELKEACLKFIQAQPPLCLQAIMTTNGWDHVYKTYPCIFKDLIAKLASNQRK